MTSKTSFSKTLLPCAALLLLGGCGPLLVGGTAASIAMPEETRAFIFGEEEVNLKAIHFGVADYLVGLTRNNVSVFDTYFKTGALRDVNNPDFISPLATLAPTQVAERMAQLGYRVDIDALHSFEGDVGKNPPKPDILIQGSYNAQDKDGIRVTMRFVSTTTGQIVGAHEYVIPRRRQTLALVTPPEPEGTKEIEILGMTIKTQEGPEAKEPKKIETQPLKGPMSLIPAFKDAQGEARFDTNN